VPRATAEEAFGTEDVPNHGGENAPPAEERELSNGSENDRSEGAGYVPEARKRFPLIHIRDETHLDEALALLNELLRQERELGTQEYLDVLTDLVAAYEDEHVPMPDVSEADVIRELMRSDRLTQV
jgi:hypothetical protein